MLIGEINFFIYVLKRVKRKQSTAFQQQGVAMRFPSIRSLANILEINCDSWYLEVPSFVLYSSRA